MRVRQELAVLPAGVRDAVTAARMLTLFENETSLALMPFTIRVR